MTTSLSDRATAEGRGRAGRVLRAEWTKFWSVPRWVLAMLAAIVLTVLMSVLSASGSGTDENAAIWDLYVPGPGGRPVQDSFHFVHQPASGDLTITAQVASQEGRTLDASPAEPEAGAMAGLVIKESTEAGSAYAAIVVTPGDGVRMDANFETVHTGSTEAAPRYLRLTRTGATITGFESADGTRWSEVGKVDVPELPDTIEVGMLVGSPDGVVVERQFGSTAVGQTSTISAAEFDNVSLEPGRTGFWRGDDVGLHGVGQFTEAKGRFTIVGSGDIAAYSRPGDDVVQLSLIGFIVGVVVVCAVGVLYVTTEYKHGMIRTSFTVSPQRRRVLATKAIVIAGVAFAVGLIAALISFQLGQPILRENGFAPPAFDTMSLADPIVWRAISGSAILLALVAVLSLCVAVITRRSASAITLVIALTVLPLLAGFGLPAGPAGWLMRLTPAGGFALQRVVEPTEHLVDPVAMIAPLEGLVVLLAHAAGAFVLAGWLLNRRDA
ncbi:MAG TPA: ABC transporter permease subunit [Jiangellaceae bacterium]